MRVVLTQIEMEVAALVGSRRRAESKKNGRKDRLEANDKQDAWASDIEGAAAEMAYCKWRNRYWSCGCETFHAADVGTKEQIRWTKWPNGFCRIYKEDLDDHYFVLVTGESPVFDIRGWISGADGKRLGPWGSPNKMPPFVHMVAQKDLHPFTNTLKML